jgi:hypothetical protein
MNEKIYGNLQNLQGFLSSSSTHLTYSDFDSRLSDKDQIKKLRLSNTIGLLMLFPGGAVFNPDR